MGNFDGDCRYSERRFSGLGRTVDFPGSDRLADRRCRDGRGPGAYQVDFSDGNASERTDSAARRRRRINVVRRCDRDLAAGNLFQRYSGVDSLLDAGLRVRRDLFN